MNKIIYQCEEIFYIISKINIYTFGHLKALSPSPSIFAPWHAVIAERTDDTVRSGTRGVPRDWRSIITFKSNCSEVRRYRKWNNEIKIEKECNSKLNRENGRRKNRKNMIK